MMGDTFPRKTCQGGDCKVLRCDCKIKYVCFLEGFVKKSV